MQNRKLLIDWIYCPICGNKTRNKIRGDAELKNFPLYCPKCKQESLIEVKKKENNCHQRARRFRRRADKLVSDHSLSALCFTMQFLLNRATLFLKKYIKMIVSRLFRKYNFSRSVGDSQLTM